MSDFTLRKGGYKTKPHEIELAQEFLRNFQDKDGVQKYKIQLEEIANLERHALEISLDDVKAFGSDPNFANDIMINTKRYTPLFSAAAFLELPDPNASSHDRGTVYDIWVSIRRNQRDPNQPIDDTFREMITKFEVHFIPFQSHKPFPLRSLRSDSVGSLISIRGVVTRVTDVLPLISVQAYHCKTCGHESYQQVSGREYTPLSECQSLPCRNNHTKGDLSRLDRGSKFRSYQEVKIQELPVEVPVGHIPRSLTVKLYGDSLVRRVKPGDITMISGIYLPTPTSNSFQRGGRGGSGLVTDTYIEASQIRIAKKNYNSIILQEHHIQELHQMSTTPNILERLAKSISPEIFGHVEIKKALLLSMVGGVTKVMLDGMKIRGDINMLLVGDPGMAKSQLLKHVCKIAPRAVYTTGKGSSGVGLTASVQRDPISGDTTLEGGALVLADNGICCIDEFDKMDENDRTSIHEVMEQQTVSIAKAGITTTLNARTTVLAAANPAYGRYNLQRSPSDNLSMPASLLSRFDLLFIMLDRPDAVLDEQLAHHVTFVHQHNAAPVGNANGGDDTNMVFSSDMLRAYISVARQYNPIVSEEASTIITQHYVETRQSTSEEDTKYRTEARDMREEINDRGRFCTARMLLSTIRISQAIARVHFSSVVTEEHARMAVDLMYATQIQLEEMSQKDMEKQNSRKRDPISTIYSVVMRLRENGDSDELSYNMIKDHVLRMGYDEAVLEKTIETYASAGVWSLTRNKKTLRFTMEAR